LALLLTTPPDGVSQKLAIATERALRHLPDELLRAMVRGLRTHADELAPGVLFRGKSSGGCAVGITLRELAPDAFDFGLMKFWLRQRWRRSIEPDVARRFPRLNYLQRYFDEAVAELDEAGSDPHPARTVGLWFAACAQAELDARQRPVADDSPPPTHATRRGHDRGQGPNRGRGHRPHGRRMPTASEVSP
jgi:hypothetical protein